MKNLHATLIEIDGNGILLTGPSGSGKTSLALCLMEKCRSMDTYYGLVSDDQIELKREGNTLIGIAPATIAGKIELPHYGVIPIAHKASTAITHAFRLEKSCPRIPDPETLELAGIAIPLHILPARHEAASARIIFQTLNICLF